VDGIQVRPLEGHVYVPNWGTRTGNCFGCSHTLTSAARPMPVSFSSQLLPKISNLYLIGLPEHPASAILNWYNAKANFPLGVTQLSANHQSRISIWNKVLGITLRVWHTTGGSLRFEFAPQELRIAFRFRNWKKKANPDLRDCIISCNALKRGRDYLELSLRWR